MKPRGFLQKVFDATTRASSFLDKTQDEKLGNSFDHLEKALEHFKAHSAGNVLKEIFKANAAGFLTTGSSLLKVPVAAARSVTKATAKLTHRPLDLTPKF